MRDDSICPKQGLCNFEASRNLTDAIIEVCTNCGKKVIYPKINGEIDNAKYTRDHRRDILQPFGNTEKEFYKMYPKELAKKLRQKYKPYDSRTWEEAQKDLHNRLKRKYL